MLQTLFIPAHAIHFAWNTLHPIIDWKAPIHPSRPSANVTFSVKFPSAPQGSQSILWALMAHLLSQLQHLLHYFASHLLMYLLPAAYIVSCLLKTFPFLHPLFLFFFRLDRDVIRLFETSKLLAAVEGLCVHVRAGLYCSARQFILLSQISLPGYAKPQSQTEV